MTPQVELLWLKLLLAPSLVALVSIVTTRLGPRLGGILGAFPMVSGPVLLLFALEQGPIFTTEAAYKTLYGSFSLVAYCVVYALITTRYRRLSPFVCLPLGWAAFVTFTFLLEALPTPRFFAAPFALASILLGLASLPRPRVVAPRRDAARGAPATQRLPLRMGAAALLVFSLSEAAGYLGPKYSGLLTPFPVASSVLLVATHLEQGTDAMLGWLQGFVNGLFGYVTFVLVAALLLERAGLAIAFSSALVLALVVQTAVTRNVREPALEQPRPPSGEAE